MKTFLRRITNCSVALMLAAIISTAHAPGVFAQAVSSPQENRRQDTLPTVDSARIAALVTEFDVNGLKVLVKRRAGSQTVAAGIFLRGGARNLTPQNAGIEDLMLETATRASRNFPRERLRSELSRMGTSIGSGANYDYSALTLATTRTNFDRSWEIFTDVALRPAFTEEDFALVKNQQLTGLREETTTPDALLESLQSDIAYAGHPYINRPQGTLETVGRMTLDDLRRYHTNAMQTSRLLIVIVGDLDPAQVRSTIAASFGQLPRGNYRAENVPALSFNASTVEVTTRTLPTNYVQGVFVAPPLTSPDIYPMRVAISILREQVFEEVRNRRNLSYAPNVFLRTQAANVGGLYVTSTDANQAVGVMLDEVARLQQNQITPQAVSAIGAQYLTDYYMTQETNAAQAGELAMYELIGGGWRNSTQIIERLRLVTPEDVQRVARQYMRNIRFVVVGNPAQIDRRIFTRSATSAPTFSGF
jgi:zinc protease